jgi:hypothetical protein
VVSRGEDPASPQKVLRLYVDGVERAPAVAIPDGMKLTVRTDHRLRAGFGGSTTLLDEIRISSSAHSSDQIDRTYKGAEGNLGLAITQVTPQILPVGATTEVMVTGYNLAGVTSSVLDASGAIVPSQVTATSATQARINITVGAQSAIGLSQLQLSGVAGTATTTLRIVDLERSVYGVEGDTRLLWHLDESDLANGDLAVPILDAGPLSIDGIAAGTSEASSGRFAGGRRNAQLMADDDFGALSFEQSSFTVEFWMKSGPVTQSVNLLERVRGCCGDFDSYRVALDASGALRGYIQGTVNTVSTKIEAVMSPTAFNLDDDQWHAVAMVVSRGEDPASPQKVLRLYVDGVERAPAVAIPDAMKLTVRADHRLRAGFGGANTLLDEIRIVNFARTAAQISDTWFGTNSVAMSPGIFTILQKALVARDKEKPYLPPMPPPKPPINLPPPDTGRNARATGGGK